MYGPTEATVWCTCRRITDPRDCRNIGKPVSGTTAFIFDEEMQPVPPGVAGELYIGGIQVAKGYLGQPEKTAERFIANPLDQNEIIYKTGDLASFTENGEIGFIGRADFQVKIRGYRIELGEIESVMASYDGVAEAVATVWTEESGGEKYLVGYFTARSGAAPAAADIRAFLQTQLPNYMIPLYIIPLESAPKTLNGKVDRKALPAPVRNAAGSAKLIVPAANATQMMIVDLWKKLLGMATVSVEDSFFELGGTSLLAVKFVGMLQEISGKEIAVMELFRHPTITAFAEFLDSKESPAMPVASAQKRGEMRRKRIIGRKHDRT
jgi:hypothetical protein